MTLAAGSSFGPYTILTPLGAGGMGAVYRARDSKLGRDVAIKVLPPEFAADRDRLARFEQEARSASALNHPNIITIFEVGQAEETPYIAMEVVEGRSLRDLLDDGKLPLRKAIGIAAQIADGLAAAHERGVVHRDLKPENVMVTKSGHVKLLDFGLAKLAAVEQSEETVRMAGQTRPGTVMGTVGYMSPEQAAGTPADFRSDQFSLGAMLYEMLTGRRAFQKATSVETLAAILREEPPPIAQSNAEVPTPLRWIVERCLAKTADERYDSTRDLARDLQRVRDSLSDTTLTSGPAAVIAKPRRRFLLVAACSAALLLAAAAWMTAKYLARPALPEFHRVAFRRGFVSSARFTADGQTILYGAAWEGQPIQLFSTREGNITSAALAMPPADVLAISKSGQIALSLGRRFTEWFVSNGTLAEAPLTGGSAPRERETNVQEADWLPDGQSLAVVRNVERQTVLEFPAGQRRYTTSGWISHARVSPDGSSVAYFDHPLRGADNGWLSLIDRTGAITRFPTLYASAQGLAWRPDGKEIWYTAASIGFFSQLHAINPSSGKDRVVLRSPTRLVLHDISPSGRLLLDSQTPQIGIAGMVPGAATERDLSWLDCSFAPDISADGKTVVISEQGDGGGPQYAVYIRPTDGSPATRIADGFAWGMSPDGKWVITQSGADAQRLTIVPTGAGTPKQVVSGVGDCLWPQFFPDGKRIYYGAASGARPARLYAQSVDGGKAVPISPEGYGGALVPKAISPDGTQIAVSGPQRRLMLVPVQGGSPRQVAGTIDDENALRWSADSRYLFTYVLGESPSRIYRIELQSGQRRVWREFHPGDPASIVFVIPTAITPDGSGYAYTYMKLQSELFVVDGAK